MRSIVDNGFYRAFEDRYRGSRELILSRLRAYLPFVEPLRANSDAPAAVDLGCGRGEWLELLGQVGYRAVGVDTNDAMLEACRESGLHVATGDALEHLATLPDESQHIVSAFHVVEHLPFEIVRRLIGEAYRVLCPGGLLILETPNPENITVSTVSFHLDPTHDKPLPPQLLSFAVEFQGFERTKIVRLQEAMPLDQMESVTAIDILTAVSPDYSVVAQKGGNAELLEATKAAFDAVYGVGLRDLARRADEQTSAAIGDAREVARQALGRAFGAEAALRELQGQVTRSETRINRALEGQLADRARADAAEAELRDLHASTSWRLTAPVRGMKLASRTMVRGGKHVVRRFLERALLTVRRYPALKRPVIGMVSLVPAVRRRLTRFGAARPFGSRGASLDSPTWNLTPDEKSVTGWEDLIKRQRSSRNVKR